MTQTNRFPEVEGANLERRPFVLPRDIEREFENAALWAFGRRKIPISTRCPRSRRLKEWRFLLRCSSNS